MRITGSSILHCYQRIRSAKWEKKLASSWTLEQAAFIVLMWCLYRVHVHMGVATTRKRAFVILVRKPLLNCVPGTSYPCECRCDCGRSKKKTSQKDYSKRPCRLLSWKAFAATATTEQPIQFGSETCANPTKLTSMNSTRAWCVATGLVWVVSFCWRSSIPHPLQQ